MKGGKNKQMEFNEEEKSKLLQRFREYPRKEDFKKLKSEVDFVKIAQQYFQILKAFLEFVNMKDTTLKDKFKIFLENDKLNQLPDFLNKLERGWWCEDRVKKKIGYIIEDNSQDLNDLQSLIFYLISEDKKKSEDVSLSKFEFKNKKSEKVEKPKNKKGEKKK